LSCGSTAALSKGDRIVSVLPPAETLGGSPTADSAIKRMKFLPIPSDIRHWGGLSPATYHTVEPDAGRVPPWADVGVLP
jgi:hypothetical protein